MTTPAPADAFASALGALLSLDPPAQGKQPDQLAATAPAGKPGLVVAYSGGRDSTVLLHLAFAYARAQQLPLRAIHINHRLQAAAADFVSHCRQECHALNIPLQVITVAVNKTGKGLEADARTARYRAFAASLAAGEILLLGQHADDQIETLLLQLLRGAGPLGLAGMPATAACGAGQLCRPLLTVRRDALTALAERRGWRWIDDPSNADHALARNRLRAELMPVLLAQRDGAAGVLLRAMQWQTEAVELQADLAALDAETVSHRNGLLSRSRLLALSPVRQANLLRWWLQQQQLPSPNAERLHSFLQQLPAASDQVWMHWGDQQLRVTADQIAVLPHWSLDVGQTLSWSATMDLPLPAGLGELHWQSSSQSASGAALTLRKPAPDETVSVRWQAPGVKLALPGRQGRRDLKDVFQEARIPAWLRPLWPKLFYNDELVALPGIVVSQAGLPTTASTPVACLHATGALFTLARRLQKPDVQWP